MTSAMKRTMTKVMQVVMTTIAVILGLELAGIVSAGLHWGGCE